MLTAIVTMTRTGRGAGKLPVPRLRCLRTLGICVYFRLVYHIALQFSRDQTIIVAL